ncbi:DUF2339 domain-containing protein [Paenibacillus albidus]|uniref:DUF2339 domain-containing protein n=1 Tax=Paenibacillus albidus TaxID=2041023 RepID=UPI001BE4F0B0|nr:DUF2339 domain-containing protein [Paenibacillus albidus]MBT2290186.1 DUF2339 domain-containing protein [Paenibacillus albidus]
MEQFRDRLKSVKEQQDVLIKDYQALIAEYESSDLVHENEQLKKQYEEQKDVLTELKIQAGQLRQENSELRTALSEQMLDEKLNILKVSRQKLETYFASVSKGYTNRLTAFEQETKHRIERMYSASSRGLGEEKMELSVRMEALSAELNERILRRRLAQKEAEQSLQAGIHHKLGELAEEGISPEVLERRKKQNQMEMKIGLNWINRLGILLLILAVGAGFRYTYSTWFNGYMKGSAFFLMGALMVGGGEWLFRKGKGTFALGLLGGGISVLYGSIFYSYFLLDIISIYMGLSLSVLVTLTAVLLSLRYESRTICSLGLIGGYLPLFSYIGAFGLSGNAVYVAMGYLFVLNLFILLISLRKRWVIVNYISFLFNAPSVLVLLLLADSNIISMLYVVLTFAMYLGITLWYPLHYRSKLSWWDFSLLGTNTLISCVALYSLFIAEGLGDYKGALALLFCLMYLGLGRFLEQRMPQEKQSMLLFYATSLTFAVLMIPFQLGTVWWSIGWLVEAVVLTVYGHLNRFKSLERAGWGILVLCLAVFFGLDVPLQTMGSFILGDYSHPYFSLRYTFITAGMLAVALLYAVQHSRRQNLQHSKPWEVQTAAGFKYAALLNVWAYALYESSYLYKRLLPEVFTHKTFYNLLLAALITLLLAYGLTKLKIFYDTVIKYYSWVLYGVGYAICIAITMTLPSLKGELEQNTTADYIALFVLTVFNIFVWFSGRGLILAFIKREYKSMELYPVIMAVYLLGILTAFLGVQLQLSDAGLIFSLVYLLLAVLFIMYGFRQRYVYIRRMGLGLTLLSTGKLLLYDLSLLNTGNKIVAYFSFGVCLLGISYLYQRVSSRMEDLHEDKEQDTAG